MKAWLVCDDIHDSCDIVLAETAGRARMRYGSDYDIDRWDLFSKHVRVRRAPKCDGFEGSDDQLHLHALVNGYFGWIFLGCHCTIEAHEAGEVVVSNGHTWCREAHRAGLPGGAKGNRHYA